MNGKHVLVLKRGQALIFDTHAYHCHFLKELYFVVTLYTIVFHYQLSGDPEAALRLTNQLIALGADVSLRSRWTNMNALHYAAYFDVPELIRVLLKASKPKGQGTHIHNI